MPLFEVAVIEKKDEDLTINILGSDKVVKNKKRERLLLAPKCVLAVDEDTAKAKVLMECKEEIGEYDEDLLEVLCRPFFE